MKLLGFFIGIIGLIQVVNGQSISHQVVASVGGSAVVQDFGLDWTVGEVAVETKDPERFTLTQGFHQPRLTITSLTGPMRSVWSVKVYPNPTLDFLILEGPETGTRIQLEWTDLLGRRIDHLPSEISSLPARLDLSQLAGGQYLLRLSAPNRQVYSTYKIQKLN
ncbi:Por secretion system C-terminal sorting domain-containing protein [Catalinimonas alkaloidigena]|uniref:Por secretion system C-terminal sorting domain-containing protein n=1 Tax=Catalinimonas alkaloidigena TaxID=1075417 RepID=A0A1G9HG04_9BACT|nr:T9SS type A sorting domain-containing protein [Catalinimonas alkaloidigena]SDL11809.1 Por secretion system C-terminal sorting domain-containing protein [Catalinimonas alkaloidigena]